MSDFGARMTLGGLASRIVGRLRQRGGAAILVVGIALSFTPCFAGPRGPCADGSVPCLRSEHPVAVALERTGRKLAAGKLRGDEAWLVFQAAATLGGEFPAWAEGLRVKKSAKTPDKPGKWNLNRRVYRIRSHEYDLMDMPEDPGELPTPDADPSITDHELTRLNRVMDWSMRCRELNERELGRLRWELQRPSKSYVLAHQLWAAVTSISFGCIDREWGTRATVELARHVLAELLALEETSDLSIEHMAFLCYANAYHWIPDEKYEEVLRDQKESGSWGTLDLRVNPVAWVGPEHTMALAFYALAHRWVRISTQDS